MARLSLALVALALGLVAGRLAAAPQWTPTLTPTPERYLNAGRNDYFVLEPGYRLTLEGQEGPKHVTLVVTVLDETVTIDGVTTRIVEECESADGKLVEVSRNFLVLGATTRNLYYFGEDVDVYEDDRVVSHEGAWRSGASGATFGILIPGRLEVGDRYYSEQAPKVAMDRRENLAIDAVVTTRAGQFERCLRVKETTPLESGAEYKSYAPGVGLVQDGGLMLVRYGATRQSNGARTLERCR